MNNVNDDLSELVSKYAIENFKSGLNCSESVLEVLIRAGVLSMDKETVGMCTGFGGCIGAYPIIQSQMEETAKFLIWQQK